MLFIFRLAFTSLIICLPLVSFPATTWTEVPQENFSYARPFNVYESPTNRNKVGYILLDLKYNTPSGQFTYGRGLIDCLQIRFTKSPKAIELIFGRTVSASPYEQEFWWQPIHPEHWAINLVKDYCWKPMK